MSARNVARSRASQQIASLVAHVRRLIPDFCQRPMTFEDFLGACATENIDVQIREYIFDGYTSRRWKPIRITLNRGLAPTYRTFVAFHELAHYVGHPHDQAFYLQTPGLLARIEREAHTIGFLALHP